MSYLENILLPFVRSGDINLILILGGGAGILLIALLVTLIVNALSAQSVRVPGYALWGSALAMIVFVVMFAVYLSTPGAYKRHIDFLTDELHAKYKQMYHGNFNDACLVFQVDENGYLEFPRTVDGQPVLDENGEPVTERRKVRYRLLARPVGPELGLPALYFTLGSDFYPEWVHGCKLPLTQQNLGFAQQAQEAWDSVHGTEPEEGEGQQQGEGDQSGEGEGRQQGEGSGDKPAIMVELPDDGDANSDADEQEGDGEENAPANRANNDPDRTLSSGSITIEVPGEDGYGKKE